MAGERSAYVHEAELRLEAGVNPAAVGAAVTTALCGHWEHDGPCRWPHNSEIERSGEVATFRTIFVAAARDEDEVRARIERALMDGPDWVVLWTGPRAVSVSERPLARRLAVSE